MFRTDLLRGKSNARPHRHVAVSVKKTTRHHNQTADKRTSRQRHVRTLLTLSEFVIRRSLMRQSDTVIGEWCMARLPSIGPTFVKIGQYIASRSDIFGKELCDAMKGLRDSVPADVIDGQLTEYCQFLTTTHNVSIDVCETPIASASIGQVHIGVITFPSSGSIGRAERVVLKIKRPDIDSTVSHDTEFIAGALQAAEAVATFGPMRLDRRQRLKMSSNFSDLHDGLEEFNRLLSAELDYGLEAQNGEDFAIMYRNNNAVRIPRVYTTYCTKNVIAMEHVATTSVLDTAMALSPNPMSSARRAMANDIMLIFIEQVVRAGLLHGDPHLGNMGVDSHGRLVLFDFGNVLRLSPAERQNVKEVLFMLIARNDDGVVAALQRLGATVLDREELIKYIRLYREYLSTVDSSSLREVLQTQQPTSAVPIRMTDKLMRLFRSYTILEGTCKSIYPDFSYDDIFQMYSDTMIYGQDTDFVMHRINVDTQILLRHAYEFLDRRLASYDN